MQGILYKRLFDRRADLIPNLTQPTEGASFYAPPGVEGDITSTLHTEPRTFDTAQ